MYLKALGVVFSHVFKVSITTSQKCTLLYYTTHSKIVFFPNPVYNGRERKCFVVLQ